MTEETFDESYIDTDPKQDEILSTSFRDYYGVTPPLVYAAICVELYKGVVYFFLLEPTLD